MRFLCALLFCLGLLDCYLVAGQRESTSCKRLFCLYGGRCQLLPDNKSRCVCPACTKEYEPVCGSDGRIYGNNCSRKWKQCMKRVYIDEMPMSFCESAKEQEY